MRRTAVVMRMSTALLGSALLVGACTGGSRTDSAASIDAPGSATSTTPTTATPEPAAPTAQADDREPQRLVPEVISVRPHDGSAWTQGLILYGDRMFESTGATPPPSSLREVDQNTGEVERLLTLDAPYYAEGLERVGDTLIQLTWQDGLAFIYDLDTFDRLEAIAYEGEGWGLCLDGDRLIMSDGTDQLQFRDPNSFEPVSPRVSVTVNGQPLGNLNELECVDGTAWANVWTTDTIVGIDPDSGAVTHVVDASGLQRPEGANVMNGIAFDPETGNFLVTGKYWPDIYEVRWVPSG